MSDDTNAGKGGIGLDGARQLEAVRIRHKKIDERDIVRTAGADRIVQHIQSLAGVLGGIDVRSQRGNLVPENISTDGVVIDDQCPHSIENRSIDRCRRCLV